MRSTPGEVAASRSKRHVLVGEHRVVDAVVGGAHQRAQARVLAVGRRATGAGLALEPDVDVEAGLMAGMAARRGPAARLADVADVERRLAGGAHLLAEALDEVEGDGLAPVAVAADADGLVARPVERQGLRALQAAGGVEADGLGRSRRGVVTWPHSCADSGKGHRHGREQRNHETRHLVGTIPPAKTLPMADYANIKLERDGAVARLMLNRPERRNALTHAMMLELEDAFAGLRQDNRCRALVIRGAGGHFCAGGDLDAMADMPPKPTTAPPIRWSRPIASSATPCWR
jgi:hypothetical protein